MKVTRIDHIAIAVEDIDSALGFFRDTLGLEVSHTDVEEDQGVVVAFLPLGESELELIEPVAGDTGVSRWLAARGQGMHHICLEVADLDAALTRLHERGVQMIDDVPYIGAGGRRIAFVHPRAAYGVLVELYEEMPGEVRRNTNLDELRRRAAFGGRVAAAGTRGFLGGLRNRPPRQNEGEGQSPKTADLIEMDDALDGRET